MRFRHIVDLHPFDPALGQPVGDMVGHPGGVVVHGGINDDGFVVGLAAAPLVVESDHLARLTGPYRSVQRTERLHLERGELGQRLLYHPAVLAHDVGVVAPHLLLVLGQVGQLIGHGPVGSPERTERISREKNLFGRFVRHHGLRPMHPGGHVEMERMIAQRQRVAVLHLYETVAQVAEIAQQNLTRHGIADEFRGGITPQYVSHFARMIRFHVVHHQVVEFAPLQNLADTVEVGSLAAELHRVEQHALLVAYKIGVVGDSVRDGPDILEQSRPTVVYADQIDTFGNTNIRLHTLFILRRYNIVGNCYLCEQR